MILKKKTYQMSSNTPHQNFSISKSKRNFQNGHNSFLIFFTGLSGSGKSTISNALEILLHKKGYRTYTLDGDNLRNGLNSDLGFEPKDRKENLRRVGEISRLFINAGMITLASFIAPFQLDRRLVQKIVGENNYIEVYISTSLKTCEARDVKGLYAKARNGEIKNLTGISSPYEVPKNPAIKISENQSVNDAVLAIYNTIQPLLKLV